MVKEVKCRISISLDQDDLSMIDFLCSEFDVSRSLFLSNIIGLMYEFYISQPGFPFGKYSKILEDFLNDQRRK